MKLTPTVMPGDAANKALTWESSAPTIATVDNQGEVTGVAAGTATIIATAADGSKVTGTTELTVKKDAIPVSKITLDPNKTTIAVGGKLKLTPTVMPDDALNKTLTWSSNNDVATVDSQGEVTGVKAGTATITATAADGSKVTGIAEITVKSYNTESEIRDGVTGVYSLLRVNYNSYHLLGEMPSDNAATRGESESAAGFWDKFSWSATTTNFESIWTNYYNTIAQCNFILSKIDGVQFAGASAKVQYTAELKFIRALMYFDLVHFFRIVPIITQPITSAQQATLTNATVGEVYAQIEKDLKDAEDGAPRTYSNADLGRATSGAAKALLGKVYLYQKKYQPAADKLKEVIDGAIYALKPNPGDVFSTTDEYNSEVIFTVRYSGAVAGEGSPFAVAFAPESSGITQVSGKGLNIGTLDLYRLFKTGDKRKDLIGVFRRGNPPPTDSTDLNFYFYTKKFTDNPSTETGGENNWIVIRYADVLLLYAEAMNELGNTMPSLDFINKIRARAELSSYSGLSQEGIRKAIKLERRLEFCFEGHRWPDLVRWGDFQNVMNSFRTKYGVTTMNPGSQHNLFPIPQKEITANPNLKQNPGY